MDFHQRYKQWLTDDFFGDKIRKELASISDEKEIEDRFCRDLKFGTGGLRGLMGAGTNRMNEYTIGRATKGLGDYLIATYGISVCQERGVVIGHDTRNMSTYFSHIVANVLSGMGIRVYLDAYARPTPQLSFSVTFWNALAGVVITASHNPKEYNGYKVYDQYGCQLIPCQAEKVINYIDTIEDYHQIKFDGNQSLISMVDVTDNFILAVLKQSRYHDKEAKERLKIVYTPIHGTGNIPVQKALRLAGFQNVELVSEQIDPDGDFPTVVSPNPEDRGALKLGIQQAERMDADIVLGTDPDCDRVGVAVKGDKEYQLMTGNQIGALLVDYVLTHTELGSIKNPAVIKTIVTSELGAEIARKRGVTVFSTLTGFKFIGEKITQFELAKENSSQDYTFLFGYEESCGYLTGTHARDKDAVVSALLICEMAAEYKANGISLLDRMNEIYAEFGYYRDALDSFTLEGSNGVDRINSMMAELRASGSPFPDTVKVTDYIVPVEAEPGFGTLPTADVLRYDLSDGSWIAVRPSGTEPKIKIYYSIQSSGCDEAEKKLEGIQSIIRARLSLKK